jgi:hypothetical protein
MQTIKYSLLTVFILISLFFATYSSDEYYVTNAFIYLFGPLSAAIVGLFVLNSVGWSGKKMRTVRWMWYGLVSWLVAEITYFYLLYKGLELYPSLADLFFIFGYVGFTVAVLYELQLFKLRVSNISNKRLVSIAALFVLVLGFYGFIAIQGWNTDVAVWVNLVTMSWSIGDIIVGGLTLLLLCLMWDYADGMVSREWIWIILAFTANFIPDTLYTLDPDRINTPVLVVAVMNILWFMGYFFFISYFLQVRQAVQKIQQKIIRHPAS